MSDFAGIVLFLFGLFGIALVFIGLIVYDLKKNIDDRLNTYDQRIHVCFDAVEFLTKLIRINSDLAKIVVQLEKRIEILENKKEKPNV